jgi:hypothetical protein
MRERTRRRLARAIRGLRVAGRPAPPASAPASAPTRRDLRGRVERLEGELREVRGRVNAIFFAVIAVALGDLVARAIAG